MTKDSPKSIVFISGTFIGNNCWDEWKQSFGRKGYTCTAPAWPNKDASPEELRNRYPNSAIASNRLNVITDYYAKIAKALPEEPILIGHSLGGLVVQLLLQRGIGAAGIAIHSFPQAGLFASKFLFLKAVWPAMGFLTSPNKTYMVSYLKWKHTIVNGIPCVEQKQLFYNYAIPESKFIIRDVFGSTAKIDFKKYRPPLLLISGSRDRIVPASLVLAIYKRYRLSNSITDYKDFNDRNHLPFEHQSCNEEADFILYWLQGIK
jgi:pimeloyl-ACP methyl ester carboxylesterase